MPWHSIESRYAAAIATAYVLGWSLIVFALFLASMSHGYAGTLVIVRRFDEFLEAAAIAWACFTAPCVAVVYLLEAICREERSRNLARQRGI